LINIGAGFNRSILNAMIRNAKLQIDLSTEEKIKAAARIVFTKKGFAGTRTRDIAREADINLALLNYYFRSKQKLFELVMMENFQHFIKGIQTLLNEEGTSLEMKIENLVASYIDLLTIQPDLPLFVLHEIRVNPKLLVARIGVKELFEQSVFMKQFRAAVRQKKVKAIHPIHLLMNLMGLTIFPFVAAPLLLHSVLGDQKAFLSMMGQRKKMIPVWIHSMMYEK
jgi:AcrR family transcriptional regulator